ncbi:MAG: VapE domain-containing protein [Casimicrobium sp.]
MAYGASIDTWKHFARAAGLAADLLPVVSNPNAEISENSKMKDLGKTPSVYNAARKVAGFPHWPQYRATENDIMRWRREPDYGVCIQTRTIRAIDIDVPDKALAQQIVDCAHDCLGLKLPRRSRQGTGKTLLAYRLEMPLPKRTIPVLGGIIEFLGDGQQFIASGQHKDGNRYLWEDELPTEFPVVSPEAFDRLWSRLCMIFAAGEPKISKERLARTDIVLDVSDERASWLAQNWEVFDTGSSGELFLRCPFEDEHTTDTGESATAYFPAGTGGFERGHWKCLHAHCDGREDDAFDTATGYKNAGLSAIPVETAPTRDNAESEVVAEPPWPGFGRDKAGKIEPTRTNISRFLGSVPMSERWVAYDNFHDQIMWAPAEQKAGEQQWQPFGDENYIDVLISAEKRGFKTFGADILRLSVLHAAKANQIDAAQEWLERCQWDGVPRVHDFLARYFGVEPTAYSEAVSRYIWTAHAGRIMVPGVQADMAPVFIGAQGARKTTAIKAISPQADFYVEINLTARDDDLSRKLRGKLVGELEELRGLNSRDSEEIKAWISRTHEEWVPKYREFGAKYARRLLFYGSGNVDGFLADPTGERRWLPFMVATHGTIDPEGILAVRDQLWAEGLAMFRADGVHWQDAERLAKAEHLKFKVGDLWSEPVARWMHECAGLGAEGPRPVDRGFTTLQALSGIGLPIAQATKVNEIRMARVLSGMGLIQTDGVWTDANTKRPNWMS